MTVIALTISGRSGRSFGERERAELRAGTGDRAALERVSVDGDSLCSSWHDQRQGVRSTGRSPPPVAFRQKLSEQVSPGRRGEPGRVRCRVSVAYGVSGSSRTLVYTVRLARTTSLDIGPSRRRTRRISRSRAIQTSSVFVAPPFDWR
ncbi:hypothetical protein C9J85_13810 [Haloferax sp. wsp5]|nr:hypothetical protein C9J85_13810 [Haloferax sp. wsp5]